MDTSKLVKAYAQFRTDPATGERFETIYLVRFDQPNGECWTSGERPFDAVHLDKPGQVWSLWAQAGGLPAGDFEFLGNYGAPELSAF